MSGSIFISYRRGDDPGSTGRLFERLLAEGFPSEQVFMDIDSIQPGVDFVDELRRQVDRADVMLAVIGKSWLDARDDGGARRLDSPGDFVRIEIEAALKQNKRVIPVLVQDAAMPRADDLPDGLKALATRNYIRLTHDRFRIDAQVLVKALRTAIEEVATARAQEEELTRLAALARAQRQESRRASAAAAEVARRPSAAALSPEQIAKAEELANWDFIKESADPENFRDHLARFPGGVCERMARHRLAALTWTALNSDSRRDQLAAYIRDFPNGPNVEDAKRELAFIDAPRNQPPPAQVAATAPPPAFLVDTTAAKTASPGRANLSVAAKLGLAALGIVFLGLLMITLWPSLPRPRATTTTIATSPAPAVPQNVPAQTPVPPAAVPVTVRCPDASESAYYDLTLNGGFKPFRRSVSAGGGSNLAQCKSDMSGWVSARPDVGLRYEGNGSRNLVFEANASIDTVLAIIDPTGRLWFDDDGAGNTNPRITIARAPRGRYAIWVGTYSEGAKDSNANLLINERAP